MSKLVLVFIPGERDSNVGTGCISIWRYGLLSYSAVVSLPGMSHKISHSATFRTLRKQCCYGLTASFLDFWVALNDDA